MTRTAMVLLAVVVTACSPGAGPQPQSSTTADVAPSSSSTSPSTTTTVTTLVDGRPGAAGVGDDLYPTLGNGGYDALHYDLVLGIDPANGSLDGSVVVTAVAKQPLSRFNLDLTGLDVTSIEVDGQPARFRRRQRELAITPAAVIPANSEFSVRIRYSGIPSPGAGSTPFGGGWQHEDGLVYVIDQPDGASSWFPVNDHPRDRATFKLTLDVPPGFETVTSGLPVAGQDDPEAADVWEIPEQTAPYLVALAVGQFEKVDQEPAGGISLTLYYPGGLEDDALEPFAAHQEMLSFFSERFGPFPYDRYGAVIVDDLDLGGALETQTLSTFGVPALALGEQVVAHEMAHQWFGNSVHLSQWRHIWLNEGMATFSQWLWQEETQGRAAYDRSVEEAYAVMSGAVFEGEDGAGLGAAEADRRFPPPTQPTAGDLFNPTVYLRGGLALVGLRDLVGDEAMSQLVSEWYRRFAGKAVTTTEFEDLVAELAGAEAVSALHSHLYDPLPPAMPQRGLTPLE